MKAMIMAAGVGSRLMPMTADIPKPMIPMANRPLMENTLDLLAKYGFADVIANLHYHGDVIRDYFAAGESWGVNMIYSPEPELMGTAGGVKKCAWFFDETFVVISGDALTDINLEELLKEHRRNGALATIALKPVDHVEQFGVVVTDEKGRIEKFQEKPQPQEALSKTANTGIYVFEPEIFSYIPADEFYDFGKQVFPTLVQKKAPFYGHVIDDYWCDVGNINTYRQAHADILCGRVDVNYQGQLVENENQGGRLLGNGVRVGNNVTFKGQVVIGSGCHIEDNVFLENTVVWNDTRVGENTVIKEAVVGSLCRIGRGSYLSSGATIASRSRLGDGSIIVPENE
ncbi:Nucleotide-diphospho-sugar transferases [Syntrophomonas zehnderi OL-4]|uniref:Nucleotide-diphospho-sugar transferases n=1 Tax=Syntrophomonas zehnderi OL-4 TaxID=690567 RepID=A0A0E4C972_9FIRM|nr:NDP-sugar synthase [Syntrophomonas zehnderi]CFX85580.1 Nucleotide-diphospho-sugar transferases [Syntrophomonas zehnderi OL-4]